MAPETPSAGGTLRDIGRRAAVIARTRVPGGPAVLESLSREVAAGAGLIAGGLAYRMFVWLVPFGLVVAAITSSWAQADPDGFERTAQDFGLAGAAARSARVAIEEGSRGTWYFVGVGMTLLLWAGISAVRAIRVAYQIAWAVKAPRLRNPIGASLLFTVVFITVAGAGVGTRWVEHNAGHGPGLAATVGLLVVNAAIALGVMRLLPHGDAPLRALLPGAVAVAVGAEFVQLFVVFYLAPRLRSSPELYGALGGATVLLLWLYVIARLVVSAAFLNATLWDRRRRASTSAQG